MKVTRLWMTILLSGFPLLGAAKGAVFDLESPAWTREYDPLFQQYSAEFFGPAVDWRVFKLQAIAESGLRHKARHKGGARGLMQVMPATFHEIKTRHVDLRGKSLYSPRWNIAAGISYNRYLYGRWGDRFSGRDRLAMMLASYNAGYSRVLKAVTKAKGKRSSKHADLNWDQVKPYVPQETRKYVRRILGSLPATSVSSDGKPPISDPALAKAVVASLSSISNTSSPHGEQTHVEGVSTIVDWMVALPRDDHDLIVTD